MVRGDVFILRLGRREGHEQSGRRYGVVLQSTAMLPRSTVIVAPASTKAKAASFRPEMEIHGQPTRVLVEQLAAVDATRLGDLIGHVTPEEMWALDEALQTVLDLR